MANKLLSVKDLHVHYHTPDFLVKAVNGISFDLYKGKSLGLVGETGAGKTSVALSILKLLPENVGKIESGSIEFNGVDVIEAEDAKMNTVRGKEISMIFQDPMTTLNPVLTVNDQISEMLKLHTDLSKKQINDRVDEIFTLVGIEPSRKHNYPHQFSGGMKQRAVIAMALACSPTLLIADEPTTALDVTIQAQILEMMRDLRKDNDTSMILITHDLGVVMKMCDEIGVVYAGEIIEYGTVYDIFDESKKHHPYTVGLFGSIPDLKKNTKRLASISGAMPDPSDLPEGCKFYDRCIKRTDACKQKQDFKVKQSDTHYTLCINL